MTLDPHGAPLSSSPARVELTSALIHCGYPNVVGDTTTVATPLVKGISPHVAAELDKMGPKVVAGVRDLLRRKA